MSEIKCIDVSTWQGSIDWKKVIKAGYGHAIIRAGFGREASQVDNQFERNYKNATAAGILIGVYWYSYATDKADAVKEAEACLQVLKNKSLDMPVFFDMEEGSMCKLGKRTLTAIAKAFCNRIIKGGFNAGVYSNPNWFTNYLNYSELKALYPIWLAQYYKEAQFECSVWQYSSTGTVPGIAGSVDMNIIYDESIIDSGKDKPSAVTPTTKPTESKKGYKVKVTASSGLNCRKGAGTGRSIVKAFPAGTVLEITDTVTVDKVKVTASLGLNCRKSPGTGSSIVRAFPNGTVLDIYEKNKNWGRTSDGWVCLDYSKTLSSESWGKCSAGWVNLAFTKKI